MPDVLLVCGVGAGIDRSLAKIKDLDVDVLVVTDVSTDRIRRAASTIVIADPTDPDAVVSSLRTAGIRTIDGVLSLGVDNPPVVARLCRLFGCPGLDEEIANDCTQKDRRIRILSASGLSTPRHVTAGNVREALDALESIGLPAVVKPTDQSGSVGVAKIDSMAPAAALVADALRLARSGRVVLEQFLVGTEHTVAGLSVGDELFFTGFSDRDYGQKELFSPYFFERGELVPTALDPATVDRVLRTVTSGVRALRLSPAVFNSDVLVTPSGDVVLIELTGRMTGARIATDVIPLATGVDLLPNAVRLALGRPIELSELRPTRNQAVVQRYLPAQGGIVDWIGDLESAKFPGVYDLFWGMDLTVGQELPTYRSSRDILAGVIASGSCLAEADEAADRALACVPLRVI